MRTVSGGFAAGIMNGSGQRASSGGKNRNVKVSLFTKNSCSPTRILRKKVVA